MRIVLYTIGYFVLLFFSLDVALNKYMDMADPPVVNPDVHHWFWLSGFGAWLWFGIALVLPAIVLFAFTYFLRWIWRRFYDKSRVVV